MGSGGSKDTPQASPPPKQPEPQPAKAGVQLKPRDVAHSAPPATDSHRRGSMMPLDAAPKPPNVQSNALLRRGSLMPTGEPGKNPNATSNNLMGTHAAMRRPSVASKMKLTRDKVGRLGDDDFGDDDDEDMHDDTFRGLKKVESKSIKEEEPPTIRFGRKQGGGVNAAAVVGNEAGGDLSNAALSNLHPGAIKGTERAAVSETTATGRKQRAFFANDDDLDEEPTKTTSAIQKIKQKAKTASAANELQRRQTARGEMGGTLTGTKSFSGAAEDLPTVNGTTKIKTLLENMKQFRYTMRAKRDMSDADVQDMHAQQDQYGKVKLHIASEVAAIGKRIDVPPPQVKALCVEFVHSIITETDRREGNAEIVAVFLKHLVTVDWATAAHEHDWLMITARDGSAKFLDALLQIPMINDQDNELDVVELLRLCIHHKAMRMPLTFIFLKHWPLLRVSELRDEMQQPWQELFAGISSHKRAIPNEDRALRMQLLNKILSLSHMIKVDFHRPDGEDGTSILQRCVAEGDTTLMSAIISNAVDVKWNHIYADGHSILSTAINANHKLIVELLLGCRDVDPFTFLPICSGHALDLARKLKSNPAIIAAIEYRMKILAPTAEVADPTKMSFAQKKRVAAGKEATGPKLPDFLANPIAPEYLSEPDWLIDTATRPVVATQQVCEILVAIELHVKQLADAKKNLLSSEAAEARYFALEDALPQLKHTSAAKIMELGQRISVEGKDAKDLVLQTVDDLLKEQEIDGNCKLIRVLMYRIITVDFAPYITDRQWAINAVQLANMEIMESLLRVSKVWQEEDVVTMINAAVNHHVKRIPLMNLLLRYAEQLRLATQADHVRSQFQEFWEGITNPAKFVVGEDKTCRKELLYRLAAAKFITLQYEQEFTGSQTVFSRACREGDIDLVEVMVNMRMLRDINRVHSNKSTALMQAVVGNQVEIVRFLVRDPTVDVFVTSPHGTALELATKMRKDPAIIEELKRASA